MFWIYIPPIVLVVALATLAIMLGRKSADLKKIRLTAVTESTSGSESLGWKGRFGVFGKYILHLVEIILGFAKIAFKKTEQTISTWVAKLKARRSGVKSSEIHSYPNRSNLSPNEDVIHEIEKSEEVEVDLMGRDINRRFSASEVIIRKRVAEEPVVIPKKENFPEDKVREAALVYRIAENPRDIEAYREIGDYYLGIGNIKDAKEAFKMVLKLRPRDLKAKSSLREIEMRMRLGN